MFLAVVPEVKNRPSILTHQPAVPMLHRQAVRRIMSSLCYVVRAKDFTAIDKATRSARRSMMACARFTLLILRSIRPGFVEGVKIAYEMIVMSLPMAIARF